MTVVGLWSQGQLLTIKILNKGKNIRTQRKQFRSIYIRKRRSRFFSSTISIEYWKATPYIQEKSSETTRIGHKITKSIVCLLSTVISSDCLFCSSLGIFSLILFLLSYFRFPRASAISTLAYPREKKKSLRGIMVNPCSSVFLKSRSISCFFKRSFRSRSAFNFSCANSQGGMLKF